MVPDEGKAGRRAVKGFQEHRQEIFIVAEEGLELPSYGLCPLVYPFDYSARIDRKILCQRADRVKR